jgi:glycosyltransferase involved in cell wall biosynthesis
VQETAADNGRAIAYVIGTYPLLTTTFIDREIDLLRQLGLEITVVSLRRPHGALSPGQRRRVGDVRYVLPVPPVALARSHLWFMLHRPSAFWGTLAHLLTRPHRSVWSRVKTLLHFGEGVHVAHMLRSGRRHRHLHAHFVDRAATVALVAGRLLDLPFSATAHANDIYVDPVLLAEKLTAAEFVVTCTGYNADHLASAVGEDSDAEVLCIHHGVDVDRFAPPPHRAAGTPVVLAVGQLKEKKGFSYLVEACGILRDRGHELECRIVGEGPQRDVLEAEIHARSLDGTVALYGALDHDAVVAQYRAATVFCLPCVTGADGDRDGIPNVILEAMAMELPVVSTRHSGIPEAVLDGSTGSLAPPGDAPALADALANLLDDPQTATTMGRRGRQVVAAKFDVATNAEKLVAHLTRSPDTSVQETGASTHGRSTA